MFKIDVELTAEELEVLEELFLTALEIIEKCMQQELDAQQSPTLKQDLENFDRKLIIADELILKLNLDRKLINH